MKEKKYKELKGKIKKIRRLVFEFFGSGMYSRPALNNIDYKLEKYLEYKEGFFIEAGANDGFHQSNTYYLERMRSWRGLLIEPIPDLYDKCVQERPNSIVFNCALVPDNFEGDGVNMIFANLMSLVRGARKSETKDIEHSNHFDNSYEITVPGRTLTSILDEIGEQKIDLFSLDVEGYELSVLKGLDLVKYRPKYILIEANFFDEIDDHLTSFGYEEIDRLSDHDILYGKGEI